MDRQLAGISICMTIAWVAVVLIIIWAMYPD